MNCEQCKYWRFDGHFGSCKRYPKTITKSQQDWCGEYQPHVMITLPVVEMDKRKPGRPAKEKE